MIWQPIIQPINTLNKLKQQLFPTLLNPIPSSSPPAPPHKPPSDFYGANPLTPKYTFLLLNFGVLLLRLNQIPLRFNPDEINSCRAVLLLLLSQQLMQSMQIIPIRAKMRVYIY